MSEIPPKKKTSKIRIYVDLFFFALMILVLVPQTTGIPIHEWGSFVIILPFFLHLIINWNWITTNSKKFFKKAPNKTRFDYVLNWTLYLFMIVLTVSGIAISESVLPLFGMHPQPDNFWNKIHDVSAALFMLIFGIHIALHWRWIVGAFGKLKFKADVHHLTYVGTILANRSRQLMFLLGLSIILSILIYFVEYSSWAEGFREDVQISTGEEPKKLGKSWMRYVLPFVKVAVLTAVPALITGGIVRLKKKLKQN